MTTLERQVRIDASPEIVFRHLVESDALSSWMGESAELDPRPGGQFLVRYPSGDSAVGEFTIVDPPTRVVFSWGWTGNEEIPPGSSTVEIVLTEVDGGTVLDLTHSRLPTAASRARHAEGWDHFLPNLVDLVASG